MRGDYGSYFVWFVDGIRERGPRILFEAVQRNVPDILSLIAYRLQVNGLPVVVASLCVLLLAGCGVARLARRAPVTLAFLVGYLAIAALWPFRRSFFYSAFGCSSCCCSLRRARC
jgi:hypothetical protein